MSRVWVFRPSRMALTILSLHTISWTVIIYPLGVDHDNAAISIISRTKPATRELYGVDFSEMRCNVCAANHVQPVNEKASISRVVS